MYLLFLNFLFMLPENFYLPFFETLLRYFDNIILYLIVRNVASLSDT